MKVLSLTSFLALNDHFRSIETHQMEVTEIG